MGLYHARFQRHCGQINHHGVDILKPALGHAFIGYAILTAENGNFITSCGAQVVQGGFRMLGLHGQDDNVIGAEFNLIRMADRCNR